MNKTLADTSFIYSLFYFKDKNHLKALDFSKANHDPILIPDVVLPEVTSLFRRRGSMPAVARFLQEFCAVQSSLECCLLTDLDRAREIMLRYKEAELDFVDCCIAALAERLNITRICTFGRRDFDIIRPAHAHHLEVLP